MTNFKIIEWYLVVIFDPLFLPGKSIHDIITFLLKHLDIRFVAVSDLEGPGTFHLKNKDAISLMQIDEFFRDVLFVEQFDWGDFFLFQNYPDNWESFENKTYPEIISHTLATVRAVDDTYIYLYSSDDRIVDSLKENFNVKEVREGYLNELDYPY